jgi:hypothetical protein
MTTKSKDAPGSIGAPEIPESRDTLGAGHGLATMPCSILHLTLHRKWFDMIASGEKREEYRQIKPYWEKRLAGRHYDAVKFVNGYGSARPWMLVELKEKYIGLGKSEWGAPAMRVFILELGAILESNREDYMRA